MTLVKLECQTANDLYEGSTRVDTDSTEFDFLFYQTLLSSVCVCQSLKHVFHLKSAIYVLILRNLEMGVHLYRQPSSDLSCS